MASKTPDPSEETADGAAGLSAILAGCRAGNREFQRQLYELYHHRIHRLMVRIVGLQDAADVTQQVFMQVFRKIGQFAGQAKFETWLYRVAVNEARQHLRKRGRHPTQPLVVEPVSRHPSDDRRQEAKELLERALPRLDAEIRAIFLLREVDGLSYAEIAEIAGIPEGTVGSRLNRARRELRQHLSDLGWEP